MMLKLHLRKQENDELKNTPLKAATTGACAAYIEDAANVTVAGTAAFANGTAVATGAV